MTTVSPEVIEKINREFEQQWLAQPSYRDSDKETAHKWFIQARQSAVIELPEKVSVGFGTNRAFTYILVDELIEKLEAKGYQVNFNQPIQG